MYRLIAYAKNGVQRFPMTDGDLIVGSLPECEIHLPHDGVGERHARITSGPAGLRIEDLSSHGTVVNGERIQVAKLETLDEIRLGSITLLVEEASEEPDHPASPASPSTPKPSVTPEGMTRHLAAISQWVLTDTESRVTLESLVQEVLEDFGGGVLFLCQGASTDNPAIRLVVASEARYLTGARELLEQAAGTEAPQWIEDGQLMGERCSIFATVVTPMERVYRVLCGLPRFRTADWSALASFQALSDLLIQGLVHHVGRYEPILPGQGAHTDLALAPGLVVGESRVMRRVLDVLRSVSDDRLRILFTGEPGSGREALARTIHLSGPRRDQPFVIANCAGGDTRQIETDLFGSEVPGGNGPLLREGRLTLAEGGTLYLEEPEHLSLDLQARLVRFLRSTEVGEKGDVRILTASRKPLEAYAAEDRFRVDLAYRLSELTVDVPALRSRREDLPLLIQGFINRFCHETGKRVTGITMRAMEALGRYSFPGNLRELENIVRQTVYLSSPGEPIDVHLLPEEVRLASIGALPTIDRRSELDLEQLVTACESAAIREALRRAGGNKSEASRLLGVSRNGLAMKMKRYGIRGGD